MPKTVKVSRAPQAREKYVKVITRREKSGAGSGTRLFVHSSAMAISSAPPGSRGAHQRLGFMSVRRPVGGRVGVSGVRVRGHGVPWSAMHVVPAGPTPCARGCMLVCETASAMGMPVRVCGAPWRARSENW